MFEPFYYTEIDRFCEIKKRQVDLTACLIYFHKEHFQRLRFAKSFEIKEFLVC